MEVAEKQAVTCLVALGIKAVIAHSFARIYYRNAINNGLLVIECPDIVPHLKTQDMLQLDLENNVLICDAGTFSFPSLPESVKHIVQAGGIIPYLQSQYSGSG